MVYQAASELIQFLMLSTAFTNTQIFAVINELLQVHDSSSAIANVAQMILVICQELMKIGGLVNPVAQYSQYVIEQLAYKFQSNVWGDFAIAISDSISFKDAFTLNQNISVVVEELINMSFVLSLNGFLYECYCVNMDSFGLTMYDNYEFDSFCQFKNNYYGIGSDGIYLLDGNDDAGQDIRSLVKTGFFNVGNIENRGASLSALRVANDRLQAGYIVIKNDNTMIFRIYNDKKQAFDYELNEVYDNEKYRFQIGSGLKGSMFQLELDTVGNWQLDDCCIIPIILERKI